MGLVGSVLFSLYIGRPLVFMRPETFIMRPHRWLQAISSYRGTLAAAPNFAYDLCCQRITSKQKSRFDLSSWRVAFNGAERVRAETLRSFSRDFSGCGFRSSSFMPCYGLAEATLFVAGGTGTDRPATRRFQRAALDAGLARPAGTGCELTACGDSRGELQVVIVDPQTRSPLPEGRIGEIWVAGDSVSAGYWRRPELSDEHFLIPESWGRDRLFLRTADL